MTADDLTFDEISEERFWEIDEDEDDTASSGTTVTVTSTPTTSTPTTSTASSTSIATGVSSTGTLSSGGYWNSAASTPNYKINISSPKTGAQMVFDLTDLGVIQVGSWDSTGMCTGWIVNASALPIQYPAFMQNEPVLFLGPSPDYNVNVRGVYSKYLTNERRAAMGLPPV